MSLSGNNDKVKPTRTFNDVYSLFKEWVKDHRYLLYLQMMIFLMSLVTCIVHKLSFGVLIRFFFFQYLCLFFQGKLIMRGLRIEFSKAIAECVFSYGLGIIALIPEYYLTKFLHLEKYAGITTLLFFICIAVCYWSAGKRICCNSLVCNRIKTSPEKRTTMRDKNGWAICLFFLLIVYVIDLITVSFVNTIPTENGLNGYHPDWLFWIGNAISFQKDLPVQNLRLIGTDLRYHYFSSIVVAQISQVTGIDVTIIGFYFSFILAAIVLVFAAYLLYSKFTKNRVLLTICMVFFLFTGDIRASTEWHYYFCPFGYDYGMAFGLLSVFFLFDRRDIGISSKDIALSSILIAATTGFKAPIMVVILICYGIESIRLICRKKTLRGLAAGIIWLGSFVFTYYVFISSPVRELGKTYYGIWESFRYNLTGQQLLHDILSILPISESIAKNFAWVISIINYNRLIFLIFIISLFVYIAKREFKNVNLWSLLLIVLLGIYLTSAFIMDGSSEMYFIMAVLPYAICFSVSAMESIWKSKRVILRLSFGIVLCTLFAFCARHWEVWMEKLTWQGICTIEGRLTEEDYINTYTYSSRGELLITREETEAFNWIRDNTHSDSIIAVRGIQAELLAGVFSQRFVWNDGSYCLQKEEAIRRKREVNLLLSELTVDEGIEKLRSEGVEYYVEKVRDDIDTPAEKKLEKVYENNAMVVYKIE